jgi:hypothetical protein
MAEFPDCLDVSACRVLNEVMQERTSQDQQWGEHNHDPAVWMLILTGEVGEAARDALEVNLAGYRADLIQVAAAAVAAIESLDRSRDDA